MKNRSIKDRESSHGAEVSKKTAAETKKRWTLSDLILLVLLAFVVYFTTENVLKYFAIRRLQVERQHVVNELSKTEKEIKELNEFIQSAQDPFFVEKLARENLKMVRPDELVYFVVK